MSDQHEDLKHIRHSLAHALAAAVLELHPHAKPTIGPATETGFYYDFDFGEDKTVSEDNLPAIEEKMREILKTWDGFEEAEVSAEEAKERFQNNPYKLELIDEIADTKEKITFYTSGTFTDLCRGGHVESARNIDPRAFKLTSVAGAYWRGDENKPMLTRIYGLAFHTKQELKDHLTQLEEAAKRDHRKLGREMDLFTFSNLVGPGLPLFTPKGAAMRNAIIDKIYAIQKPFGYQEVWIPHITKPDLYKTSGHWEKFGDELFKVHGKESEFVMKPMNCPHHTQIYSSSAKSYRDLPVRFVEATTNYRDEQTGELLGLSRVRSLTQDDGHIFCTPEQIEGEIENIMEVVKEFYTSLGMYTQGNYRVFLSVRDPNKPEDYLGDPKRWDEAESTLKAIAEKRHLPYVVEEGEAAFYGPKLDFMFKDAIGREWQLATIQLDFVMPGRFELEYTAEDGSKKTPVMIHRAIAGSLERFLSVIIEHFAGAFPAWLAPIQARVIPVNSDAHGEYAEQVRTSLEQSDVRVDVDASNESLGKRIRIAKTEKIPYLLVVGDKEKEGKTVNVESRDEGDLGAMSIEELVKKAQDK
ncbi:MAG: threonine--tRNA ligase [Candidatus Paceibacterota bacterium]